MAAESRQCNTPQEAIDFIEEALERQEEYYRTCLRDCRAGKRCDCGRSACILNPEHLLQLEGFIRTHEAAVVLPCLPPGAATLLAALSAEEGNRVNALPTPITVSPVLAPNEPGHLQDMYHLLGCHLIDLVCGLRSTKGRLYMLVIDEEGALRSDATERVNPLAVKMTGRPIFGTVAIIRDPEGEEHDPRAKAARVTDRNAIEAEAEQA